MLLSDYHPHPGLVTQATPIDRPRFPLVDAHNHLIPEFGGWAGRPLSELIDLLDRVGVRRYVALDGFMGEQVFHDDLDHFKSQAPDRFRVFCGIDWSRWPEQGDSFGDWAARQLREQVRQGADGLKVWKNFGLRVRDQHDALVAVDDARMDPVWATAGELGLPVTFHVGDPVAFFSPLGPENERWEELQAHPDWHFPSPPFPPFLSTVEGMANVVARHPATTFIGAHAGCYAENLGWVGRLIERCPNFYIDISARIAELGRQPYTARRFFIQYADRILFGIDAAPDVNMYRLYARFLETSDEYFNYDLAEVPSQGRWRIYGLSLPDDVLEKIYHLNADHILK